MTLSIRQPVRIAISTGDPLGIGPEIVLDALLDPAVRSLGEFWLFGDDGALAAAAARSRVERFWCNDKVDAHYEGRSCTVFTGAPFSGPIDLGRRVPTAQAGHCSYHAVVQAIDAVKTGFCSAMVTAPINKEAWHLAGITRYPGHTELLAEAFESKRSAMLFAGPKLRVILVTIHVPLSEVPWRVTEQGVLDSIELGHLACLQMGVEQPRIAVAGVNPHAGEHGLFGDEDERLIVPAVQRARQAGLDVVGPLPGDTVFSKAVKGAFDLVVAMYHDQGLIPAKLVDGAKSVNVTVGLSWSGKRVVRTSPAHGTAFDIAGQGLADSTSMKEAIRLAVEMVKGEGGEGGGGDRGGGA